MSETGPAYSAQYTPPSGPSGPRANFGWRLLAWFVDTIITGVGFAVLFFGLAAIDEALGVLGYILGIVAVVAYFTYFEGGESGQTPGKRVCNIRVIDFNTGGPLGFGRGLIRWVARIPSQFVCYLGYLWMLWDREKQTWHDKAAGSVVVPVDAYPVS